MTEPIAAPASPADEVYTLAEFEAASMELFGQRSEVVRGAFALAHLTTATKARAVSAVEAFLSQEI